MDKALTLEAPLLCFKTDVQGGKIYSVASGQAVLDLRAGPGKEGACEDSAAIIPVSKQSCVLIVADGVGGQPQGAQASRLALEQVHLCLKRETQEGQELRKAILDGIEKANRAVMNLGSGAATTLSIVEVQKQYVRSYHVGDSLILIMGSKGKLKFYTVPHSPVGYAVEAGILNEEEAMHHKDRHLVSNVIGSSEMKIEIGPEIELDAQDTVVLASDGLSDNLSTGEILELARKGPLDEVARTLSQKGRARMTQPEKDRPSKPDDMTFIVFRLEK